MELILLGIDGAEPSLVTRWASEGYLPNFARLIRQGAFGTCRSTIHPLTPQAWASIVTGVGPGKHGIFDFGKRVKGQYSFELVTSRDRSWPAFWEILNGEKSCGVINVPVSYPPDPVDGFFISGMHTPDLKKGVYPKGLEKKLDDYVIDVMCHWYEKTETFLDDVNKMCDARHKAALSLVQSNPVDVFFPVYVAADRVQHALWGSFSEKHLKHPGRVGDDGDAIFLAYRKMDKILGDYLTLSDDSGARLIVVSDHGFGDLKKDVYLNALLLKEGLMFFDPDKMRKYTPRNVPLAQDPTHDWQRNAYPNEKAKFGSDEELACGKADPRYKSFDTIDWSKTAAYSEGLFGNIWINLKGREPQGIIEPGAEYEEMLARITALLKKLVDPKDGKPIVDEVYQGRRLYEGPEADKAPDLIVKMRDYAYITRGSTEFLKNEIVSDVVVNHTGNHRVNGIVGLYGPEIKNHTKLTGASVYDIVPTLLHLIGRPVPEGLDGHVLVRAMKDGFLAGNPVQYTRAEKKKRPAAKGLTKTEQEIIRKRLRALGYIG